MNRRHAVFALVALCAAMGTDRLVAQAQRVARVGLLSPGTPETIASYRQAMIEGFRAIGWIEGRNLLIQERYAQTRMEDVPRLAAELAGLKPDAIVAVGPAPTMAFRRAGSEIPIVFLLVADPVGLGLANSLGRPGGNFTGLTTNVAGGFFGKQVELLREVVPGASRIALVINPGNPMHVHPGILKERAALAKSLAIDFVTISAKTREELGNAIPQATSEKADAMIVIGDSLFSTHRQLIADLAARQRLPALYFFRQHVEAGGLMSYGSDAAHVYRRSAAYVDRILKGAKAGDLPIEQPTKFELVINLKTVRALGLTIPQSVLLRADRVIE